MPTIGTVVRDARNAKNMSREALAKKLDITPQYLALIECDARVCVSERVLTILKKTLGKKIDTIKQGQVKRNNRDAYLYRTSKIK